MTKVNYDHSNFSQLLRLSFWVAEQHEEFSWVGLHTNGSCAARGTPVHPQHRQTDQEGWLQRAPHPEIHPPVK